MVLFSMNRWKENKNQDFSGKPLTRPFNWLEYFKTILGILLFSESLFDEELEVCCFCTFLLCIYDNESTEKE